MDCKIVYDDEFIKITLCPDGTYIESFKKGYTASQLYSTLSSHPEIDVTDFNVIKHIIAHAPRPPEKFGKLKERISVNIIDNGLKASVSFNMNSKEMASRGRDKLIMEAVMKLKEKGVVFGIKKDNFPKEPVSSTPYVIAEGVAALNGTDSIINMYRLEENKPHIEENGKVNYYHLKLINIVKTGDWLGERIEATQGMPGRNVKGEEIKPVPGRSMTLNYDKNTVFEETEGSKTTLYSKVTGAVHYIGDKISVSSHLDIDGDVDFKTGNIKFDGYVTIRGTVTDGFTVEATKDIEINSELGLGSVKEIVSTHGSVFIKGGISAKGKTEIRAAKNVFTKFVESARIECGETAHIGFYCVNSTIEAREVIIESAKGQIIGGNITAEVRVIAPIIGSESEKRTVIRVKGFNRSLLLEELERLIHTVGEFKAEQQKLKQAFLKLEAEQHENHVQHLEFTRACERLDSIKEGLKSLEDRKKHVAGYLKAHGEGEVCATRKFFPNCYITIKNCVTEIYRPSPASTIFVQNEDLKQI